MHTDIQVRQQGDPEYAQFLEDLRDLEALDDAKRMSMIDYINTRWIENLNLVPAQRQSLSTSGGIVTRNLVSTHLPPLGKTSLFNNEPLQEKMALNNETICNMAAASEQRAVFCTARD